MTPTEALTGPEPDSIQKLRGRAAFMRSSAFEVSDHGWLADAMERLADEIEEEMLLAERVHASRVAAHDDLVAALRDAREFVQMNLDELLESCCLVGDDGKPDRSTIDHLDKIAIDDADACLAKIDAALSKASAS